MLYVRMAVLLDEIFFQKTDPYTASIITAFTFSSTYILRPFGALIFGYIGDHIGRKATIIITTMIMSLSCVIMANLPTYSQISITASWIITICRMIQGLSTMGEVMGANIYIIETTKPPIQYPAVALMGISGSIGGTAALGIAFLSTLYGFNWRIAFWIGAVVALIGAATRTRLRETPDFISVKLKANTIEKIINQEGINPLKGSINTDKMQKKTALALFFIECSWPVCFYFSYIYCGRILKASFGMTSEQVIHQKLIVSASQLLSFAVAAFLSYKIYPLKILKAKLFIFLGFIIMCPYMHL